MNCYVEFQFQNVHDSNYSFITHAYLKRNSKSTCECLPRTMLIFKLGKAGDKEKRRNVSGVNEGLAADGHITAVGDRHDASKLQAARSVLQRTRLNHSLLKTE